MGIFRDPFLMVLSKRLRIVLVGQFCRKNIRTDLSRKLW